VPPLFLPYTASVLVNALAAGVFGYVDYGWMLFGVGAISWLDARLEYHAAVDDRRLGRQDPQLHGHLQRAAGGGPGGVSGAEWP
jgi:type IV secretory pathway TrbD component